MGSQVANGQGLPSGHQIYLSKDRRFIAGALPWRRCVRTSLIRMGGIGSKSHPSQEPFYALAGYATAVTLFLLIIPRPLPIRPKSATPRARI